MHVQPDIRVRQPAKPGQKGMTLVVVLMILVVLTLLGITGMKMGLSSLNVATNSQVSHLLYQSADAGLFHLERLTGEDMMAAARPGGLLSVMSTEGKEDVFCLTPRAANVTLTTGACSTANAANYMSGRRAVLTQVHVKSKGSTRIIMPGTDVSMDVPSFVITSTAVLPAFGSASNSNINTCLGRTGDDTIKVEVVESADATVETVTECLNSQGAVSATLVDDYMIVYERAAL